MPTVTLSDGDLWYARRRAPESPYPPLVLVHGAGSSHLDWPPELRHLPGATVLVPDLPGHGRSAGPGRQTITAYAEVLLAWLEALNIPQAIFVGHSMGGAIAQIMALDHSDRVAGVVLIGTGARLPVHPDFLSMLPATPAPVYDRMAAWMWAEDVPAELPRLTRTRLDENDPVVAHGDLLACDTFDTRDRIGQIDVPALVIGGTADRMAPFKFSVTLAEQIPAAELVTIEGGGHMMTLEQPQTVAEAMTAWLDRCFA